jgi:hypothetical protein
MKKCNSYQVAGIGQPNKGFFAISRKAGDDGFLKEMEVQNVR